MGGGKLKREPRGSFSMSMVNNSPRIASFVIALLLVSGLTAVAAQPNPFDDNVAPLQIGEQMPAIAFVNQSGQEFTLASQRGQATLVAFIYTRCRDACPIITEKIGRLNRALGPGPYHFALVTIDPAHDSPSVLAAYARKHGVSSPRVDFLTGDARTVERFVRAAGVAVVDNGRGELVHNAQLLVISPVGRLTDVVGLVAWDPRAVAAEMQHVAGVSSSPIERANFELTKRVAQFCGGSYQLASGIIDVVAALALVSGGVLVLVWMRRRLFAQGA
jgi:cytochrome oxidase Cu insertion factor (SCO1/SenC/PrrC family)